MAKESEIYGLLKDLNLSLRKEAEFSETQLCNLNLQLRQLHASGLLTRVAILGPVILIRPHAEEGRSDTGEVVQAAVGLPTGFGAVYLDTEESDGLATEPGLGTRILPYEECELAVRALLTPCAGDLLRRLMAMVKIYPDGLKKRESQRDKG